MLRPDRDQFVRKAIAEGLFISVHMRVWEPSVTRQLELPPASMLELPPGTTTYRHHFRAPRLIGAYYARKKMKIALKTMTFKTLYGSFVPGSNIVELLSILETAKKELFETRDKIVEQYDEIMAEIEQQYQAVVDGLWKEKYGHEGEPTVNFRNTLTREFMNALPSAADAEKRFKFDLVPYRLVTDPADPHYEALGGDEYVDKVCRAVWDAMLFKRRSLVCIGMKAIGQLDSGKNPTGIFKTLFSKLGGYRKIVFYDDPELLKLIDAIRDLSIVSSPLRTPEAAKALLQGMIDHIRNHDFYLVGPTL